MLASSRRVLTTVPSWDIAIVIFLASTTLIVFFLLRNIQGEKFTRIYLLSITAKILLSCTFVIIFVLNDRQGADYNAIFFLIGYIIFTAAEVAVLLLKKNS
jgi:hypothetical protein